MNRPPPGSYTMIADLPNLEDPRGSVPDLSQPPPGAGQRHLPPGTNLEPRTEPSPEMVARKIRKSAPPMRESGMGGYSAPEIPLQSNVVVEPVNSNRPATNNPLYDINCLEISQHVKHCPVCSEIYKCDRSLHNFIIFVLVVVSLLLFKGMLDAQAKCAGV